MKFWLKWILCTLLLLATGEGILCSAIHIPAEQKIQFGTKQQITKKLAVTEDLTQSTVEQAIPPFHLEMEWSPLFTGNALITPRPVQATHLYNLVMGKTLRESMNLLHQAIHRHYLSLYNISTSLKPLPVCRYYIIALRRILI